VRLYDIHSFFELRRKDAEEATIEKPHSQTNIAMAPAILVEVGDETNLSSEFI
jgi:hypothetical protein